MHPSHIWRQSSSGDSFSSRYWHNQPGRNKVVRRFGHEFHGVDMNDGFLLQIMATTALVAATTLAYYWGYQDVDKRNIERERKCPISALPWTCGEHLNVTALRGSCQQRKHSGEAALKGKGESFAAETLSRHRAI